MMDKMSPKLGDVDFQSRRTREFRVLLESLTLVPTPKNAGGVVGCYSCNNKGPIKGDSLLYDLVLPAFPVRSLFLLPSYSASWNVYTLFKSSKCGRSSFRPGTFLRCRKTIQAVTFIGMLDIVRDATFGQFARFLWRDKVFRYPEEEDDFKFLQLFDIDPQTAVHREDKDLSPPEHNDVGDTRHPVIPTLPPQSDRSPDLISDTSTKISNEHSERTGNNSLNLSNPQTPNVSDENVEAGQIAEIDYGEKSAKRTTEGNILVDWYNDHDPENPHYWSHAKRAAVALQINIYTFAVYAGSSIYVPAEGELMSQFNTSYTVVELGLALYVLGYGIGPLLWSPLSEIPRLGRTTPYILTFFIFIILTIPAAVASNMPGLLVLRFLQGFFGSPCLATGGATMQDMYSIPYLPFSVAIWVSFAFCAPALGPIISGFSIPVKGWHWSMWELLWLCAPIFAAWVFFLPETNANTILGRRAARLRKRTHNSRICTQAELDRRGLMPRAIFVAAVIKPLEIMVKDPAVLFTNAYTALTYGVYYTFFEVFPLVYGPMYGFNLGETGLIFLSVVVGCFLAMLIYFTYVYYRLIPRMMSHPDGIFGLAPEWRLRPALFFVVIFTVALIGFGTCGPSLVRLSFVLCLHCLHKIPYIH